MYFNLIDCYKVFGGNISNVTEFYFKKVLGARTNNLG